MRLAIAVLAACLAAAIPAGAQVAGPLGAAPAGTPAEQIDYWFDRLAATTDTAEGVAIGERIRALWLVSGGPTAALLIRRASDAAEAGEPTVALDLLDGLLALQPALADVRQTLILEPRHFVALSGLAQTFYQSGDKVRALEAIRASLAINPFQPGTQDLEARLEAELNRRI
jgi:hypothetical protein